MIDKLYEQTEHCDFCGAIPDYGFDMEWDALLCWMCHLAQNHGLWFMRNRFIKTIPINNPASYIIWKEMF